MGFFDSPRGPKVLCLVKMGHSIKRVRGKLVPVSDNAYQIHYRFHNVDYDVAVPKNEEFMYMDDAPLFGTHLPTFGIIFGEAVAKPLFSTTNTSAVLVNEFLNVRIVEQSILAMRKDKQGFGIIFLIAGAVLVVAVGAIIYFKIIKKPATTTDTNPPITTTIDTSDTTLGPPATVAITLT